MKYIVVLGDGMADEPIEALGGKTPLAYAVTKTLDELAPKSEIGLLHTIPEGMKPEAIRQTWRFWDTTRRNIIQGGLPWRR